MKTTTILPENFVYNDNHYNELGDLMEELDLSEDDVRALESDWSLYIEETKLEPLMDFRIGTFMDLIICATEDRCSEEGSEYDKLEKIFKENIDFAAIIQKMPELHYPTGYEYKLTKQDLLDYINPTP